jgi:predicted transcriptional regulator
MKSNALTEVVTFRVEKEIIDRIDRIALRQDRKRADVVRRIFLKAFQRDTPKGTK